jgi:SET domain-containing protein
MAANKFEVRPSPIHGLGVFATKRIKRGARIGVYEGKVTKRDGTYVLWVTDEEDGSEVGYLGQNDLRYLNHSSKPNCIFDGTELSSLRNIQPGQELTFHYGDEWMDLG